MAANRSRLGVVRHRARRAAALLSAIMTTADVARADDYSWNLSSGSIGLWSVASNWSPSIAPTSTDTARFASAGTFTATLSGATGIAALYVSAGSVNVRSTTSVVRGLNIVTGASDLVVSDGAALAFGGSGAANNPMAVALADSLAINDGSLTLDDAGTTLTGSGASSLHFVGDAGHAGTVTLHDSAVIELQGTINLASGGTTGTRGTLNVEAASRFDVQRLNGATIAGAADATINVGGTNAQLFVRDALVLGNGNTTGGTARLNLAAGGTVTLQTSGHVVNASGRITQTGGTFIGGAGIDLVGGVVDVTGGSFSFGANSTLSSGATASFTNTLSTDGGNILVTGSGTRLDASLLRINGGVVTYSSASRGTLGRLSLGTGPGGVLSTFNVNNGTAVDVNGDISLDVAGMAVRGTLRQAHASNAFKVNGSSASVADVTVDGGLLDTATGVATIGRYGRVVLLNDGGWAAHGNVLVDGGTLNANAGHVTFAAGTTLTVQNGGIASLPGVAADNLQVSVSGPGTQTQLGGQLQASSTVHVGGGGRLLVSGPLTLDQSTATVGDGPTDASRIDVSDDLTIRGPTARLSIAAGGTLDLTAAGHPTLAVYDGAVAAETGGRLVVGDHSIVNVTDGAQLLADGGPITLAGDSNAMIARASLLRIGGSLTMTNAATLALDHSDLRLTTLKMNAGRFDAIGGTSTFTGASAATVIGTLVSPASVRLAAGHQASFDVPLIVGADAAPHVEILGGSSITVGDDDITIGTTDASVPVVAIADAGSRLTATTGDIHIGGRSLVSVEDGGLLNAGGVIELGRDATVRLDGGIVVADALRASSTTGSAGTLAWSRGTIHLRDDVSLGSASPLGNSRDVGPDQSLIADKTFSIPAGATMRLTGGTVDVGSLNRAGMLVWTSGEFRSDSELLIGPATGVGALGTTLSLTPAQTLRSETRLSVAAGGLLTLAGGDAAAPAIDVEAGGEVVLAGSGRLRADGAGAIENHGLIRGDGTIGAVANAGEIRVEDSKRLHIDGALSNAGRVVMTGGTLDVSSTLDLTEAGTLTGRGVVSAASINSAGAIAFSSGVSDVHGDLTNATGGRITVSGNADVTFWDDVTNASGASLRVSAGSSATFFGTYAGAGIGGGGSLYFESDLTPGFSPAVVTFGGDVSLGSTSRLRIELGGATPGVGYDQMNVAGVLSLDGAVELVPIAGFRPLPGDAFTILTFASLNGNVAPTFAGFAAGLSWSSTLTPTNLIVRAGGFDGDADLDADVDFDDLLTLAKHYNATADVDWTDGDFDRDGRVNFDDLLALARHYGQRSGTAVRSTSAFERDWALAQSIAPEPSCISAGIAMLCIRRRRRSRR